ncbi:YpoC family protein [Fictibacillus sp. NRS-1165]|uniref:YpoC family protein n=1 Tax=Fictibacillus sp. NRS-1165 TaxID=3144463 RepID=UPI003D200A70
MLNIPEPMRHPLFFCEKEQQEEEGADVPFLEELLFYNGRESSPLENGRIDSKFEQWETKSQTIRAFFSERNRTEARKPMIFQLSCFLQALMWCNGEAAGKLLGWKEAVGKLAVKPVNSEERLAMIFSQPDHYQSFIQLNEMFLELKKKFAAHRRRA